MRYRDGEGVLQDDRQACVHFLIAGALGQPNTSLFVDKLREERLSAAQYHDAQRLADAWINKYRSGEPKGVLPEDKPMTALLERKPPNTGSGFVISSDGYFLTCAHVVEDGREIIVQLASKTYIAKLIRMDAHNDVALLKLDGADFQPIPLSYNLPEMGDKVYTVGFPNPDLQGASAKYTDGSISSLSGIMDDIRTMQITVPIQGGNSGGPLVDAAGNALGLVVAQLNAETVFEYTGTIPQNVNFAIKINYAMPLIQSVPGLARSLPTPGTGISGSNPVDDVQAATGLILVYE
jgi:S1-C subfamily serine protease